MASQDSRIVKHVPQDVLESVFLDAHHPETNAETKVYQRLRFILLRYEGYSVPEAARVVGINNQTGYNWQELWNSGGLDAMVPGKSSGRPPSLTDAQLAEFADAVAGESATTSRAVIMMEEMFGIQYSSKHIIEILRDQGLRQVKIYEVGDLTYEQCFGQNPYALRWVRRSIFHNILEEGGRSFPGLSLDATVSIV